MSWAWSSRSKALCPWSISVAPLSRYLLGSNPKDREAGSRRSNRQGDRVRLGTRQLTVLRLVVAMIVVLMVPPWQSAIRPHALRGTLALAQAASLRLDLTKISRVIIYHPMLLSSDGYGVTYIIGVPAEQIATFSRAAPSSEFEEIQVETERGAITEVRTSKLGEPSALVIRLGQSGLVAYWDLPATAKIPPPPSAAEVRRRFELAATLLAKAQSALSLKDFRGGETGVIEIRLAGVEDLTLDSRGGEPLYTYSFFALAKENMFEEVKAESPTVTLSVGVGADRVIVQRRAKEPDGPEVVLDLSLEGATWQGSRETSRPGEKSVVEDLPRPDAERFLLEGLQNLRSARDYFGIGFGRDLTGFRLP